MTNYLIPNAEIFVEISNEKLKTEILTTEAISVLLPDFKPSLIVKELEKFILPGVSEEDILNKHESELKLNAVQVEFIGKLKKLREECKAVKIAKKGRTLSNDFVWFLLQNGGLSQENGIALKFTDLHFTFKLIFYKSFADIEAYRGKSIVWVLNNPHPFRLPSIDDSNHIATSMIAAMQLNRRNLERLFPERMIGVSVIDDRFTFYSTQVSMEYLNELFKGKITQSLKIYQYPSRNGLSISNESERFEILRILSNLKLYSLDIPAIDGRSYYQL